MFAPKKRPSWWSSISAKDIATIIGALALLIENRKHTADEVAEAKRENEARVGRYAAASAARSDTLTARVNQLERHMARVEKHQNLRDRLQPLPMQYLGPPAPVRRGFWKRIGHFFASEGD